MRLALLSNVTIEVLAGMLRKEHALWLAPGFGAWMETALDASTDLKAFDPDAVFLLLDTSHAAVDPAAIATAVSALEGALPRAMVFVPDLEDVFRESADGESQRPRMLTPDESVSPFYDERMWTIGAMPWSLRGLRVIREEIGRLLDAMRGGCRKVLALDFDGTLWKGVIGENGVEGIVPFGDFQREVRALLARGVLLVGLSRNNAQDVETVWDDPRMVLGRDDFADLRVDWNEKADNLEASARALGLGTDAFVFVDDSPAERALMSARHPEVAVPDWPVSIRRLARLYFPRMRLTDEDRRRTELYRAEAGRRAFVGMLSVDAYLAGLGIRTEIHVASENEYVRVAQLSQKTNQFNVRTNRYALGDIVRFASDPSRLLATMHACDRFGDLGLVAFVHARDAGGGVWEILDWVMSCRAMNRRIEFDLERRVEEELVRRGAVRLLASWRRTAKNAPVRELFDRFGFELVDATDEERRYERPLGHGTMRNPDA